MRDELAERLLAKVMGWDSPDLARERPLLQHLADLKYDGYHNFYPGMRFVESLAVWLDQFRTTEERNLAYTLVRDRLVFVSDEEIAHFVSMVFPDLIRPRIVRKLSRELARTEGDLVSAREAPEYRTLLRRTLFLGMSDGARVDSFRRFNSRISHEQVYPTCDLASRKCEDLLRKLHEALEANGVLPVPAKPYFRVLVLMDDFSASGFTCKSKLTRVLDDLVDPTKDIQKLIRLDDLQIHVVQYIATETALNRIRESVREWSLSHRQPMDLSVEAVQLLPESVRVDTCSQPRLESLLRSYYDPAIETEDYLKGAHSRPFLGFDECSLPVVLGHNTPNDSLPILWFDERHSVRGLFPRVTRHGART